MVSRRDFLRGGSVAGLATALPAGKAFAAGTEQSVPDAAGYVVICDTRFRECDQFLGRVSADAFAAYATTADPGAILAQLPQVLADRRPLLGLSTDATLVIVDQTARASGYELRFSGIHQQQDEQTLNHRLEGNARWLLTLADALEAAGQDWADVLGHAGGAMLEAPARTDKAEVRVAVERPGTSPGHLVSWAFAPSA